jgi:hypothetical protein
MFKSDQAYDEIKKSRDEGWLRRRLQHVAVLPRTFRSVAFGLLGHDTEGRPVRDRTQQYDLRRRSAHDVEELSVVQRRRLFGVLWPRFAGLVEAAWQQTRHLPYLNGLEIKAFRAPTWPRLTARARARWLLDLIGELDGFDRDLPWLATWSGHLPNGADALSLVFAAAIDAGMSEGQAVFEALSVHAEEPDLSAGLGPHAAATLLVASRPDGWDVVARFLVDGDEGARQMILEAIDKAHPGAFVRIVRTIQQNDLTEDPAVVQTLNALLGYYWEEIEPRAADQVLDRVVRFLEEPRALNAGLRDPSGETAYLALWAMGFKGVLEAVNAAGKMTADPSVERRFAAAYFLTQVQLPEAREKLLKALNDSDLRVALCALEGCDAVDGDEEARQNDDLFERLELLLKRLPKSKTYLEPIVWPWHVFAADTQALGDLLVDYLGDRSPTRLVPYLDVMESGTRRQVIHLLGDLGEWDDATRRAVVRLVGDAGITVRDAALKALAGRWLDDRDLMSLEGLLDRKGQELYRGIVGVLGRQPDAAVLRSVERLLKDSVPAKRTAGLDVLRQMLEAGREVDRCRVLAAKLRPNGKSQSEDERKQVDAVLHLIGK